MRKAQRILLGVGYQTAARAIVIVLALATVSLSTSYLGPAQYGLLTTAVVFASFFAAFVDFGVNVVILRAAAGDADRLRLLVRQSLGLTLLYSLPLAVVVAAAGRAVYAQSPPGLQPGLLLVPIGLVLSALAACYLPLFQERIEFRVPAAADVAVKAMNLLLVWIFVGRRLPLIAFFAAAGLLPLVSVVILAWSARRFGKLTPVFAREACVQLVRQAVPIGASMILFSIYFKVDVFMLSLLRTPEEVGMYGLAYKVVETISAFPTFVVAAAFSSLTIAYGHSRERFKELVRRSLGLMVIVGVPLAAGGTVAARAIIDVMSSGSFAAARMPLIILLYATAFSFVNVLWGNVLIITQRQGFLFGFSLVNLLLNVLLNLALIPRYGVVGAAVATLATEMLATVVVYAKLRRDLGAGMLPGAKIVRVLAAAAVMYAVLVVLGPTRLVWILALGTATYVLAALAMAAVERQDVAALVGRDRGMG